MKNKEKQICRPIFKKLGLGIVAFFALMFIVWLILPLISPEFALQKAERRAQRDAQQLREHIESTMSSTKSKMRVDCEQLVQGVLKAPSTADFPHISLSGPGWRKHIDGDKEEILQVSSYVDSQNAFGAMIRTPWICGMNIRTRKVVFLEVGGKTLLDEIRRVEDLK